MNEMKKKKSNFRFYLLMLNRGVKIRKLSFVEQLMTNIVRAVKKNVKVFAGSFPEWTTCELW